MQTALVQGRIAVQFVDLLRENLGTEWNVLVWDPSINNPNDFAPMARDADVIIGGKIPLNYWPKTPKLRL